MKRDDEGRHSGVGFFYVKSFIHEEKVLFMKKKNIEQTNVFFIFIFIFA